MSASPRSSRRAEQSEESRQRILDATEKIAVERGYAGTSISAVIERSGLPASSIYWHFSNKDELFAAVIGRSYLAWQDATGLGPGKSVTWSADCHEAIRAIVSAVGRGITQSPEFLRLGLMVCLEERPVEPRAREIFLGVRAEYLEELVDAFSYATSDLPWPVRRTLPRKLAYFLLAAADGLFVTQLLADDDFDLSQQLEQLTFAVESLWTAAQ
jgi:AcrR family transcriptional regulator